MKVNLGGCVTVQEGFGYYSVDLGGIESLTLKWLKVTLEVGGLRYVP